MVTMRSRTDQFITLLQNNRFFEAHELLEELWFPRRFEDCDEVRLLRGLINAAVSFELLVHKKRENAAKRVWRNYLKYRPLIHTINSSNTKEFKRLTTFVDDFSSTLYGTILSKKG